MLVIRNPHRPLYLDPERQLEILKRQCGQVAQDRELGGEALRVLLYLYSTVTLGTAADIRREQVGQALGMKGQNVSRAIRLLCEKGIIQKLASRQASKGIELNPNYVGPEKPNHG